MIKYILSFFFVVFITTHLFPGNTPHASLVSLTRSIVASGNILARSKRRLRRKEESTPTWVYLPLDSETTPEFLKAYGQLSTKSQIKGLKIVPKLALS